MKFARIDPKSVETVRFYKISKPGNQVKIWYFTQCKSGFSKFSDSLCGRFSGRFVYIKRQSFLEYFIQVTNAETLSLSLSTVFSLLTDGERNFSEPSLFSKICYVCLLMNKLQLRLYFGLRSFTTYTDHTVYSHSFAHFRTFALRNTLTFHAQNSAENVFFQKILTTGDQVKLWYLAQCRKNIVSSAIFCGC